MVVVRVVVMVVAVMGVVMIRVMRVVVITMMVMAVAAAPVVEELLFRGLVFGALLRTTSPLIAALWSTLLFTFVHPMVSWPAVFALGLLCAALRHRGGFLPACMAAHAVYNAVVIGLR